MVVTTTTRRVRRRRNPATVVTTTTRRARRIRRQRNRAPKASKEVSPYLDCMLRQLGAAKIPDGDTKHTVAIEYRTSQTFTPDSTGGLVVAAVPGLPGSLRLIQGAGNLKTLTGGTVAVTTAVAAVSQGYSIPYPDFYASLTANDARYNGSHAILAARVVKYSMEVIQVGPVLNQQGNAATCRISSPYLTQQAFPVAFDGSAAGAVVAGLTYASLKGNQMAVAAGVAALTFDSLSTYPGAVLCNATEPCLLLGKGCGRWVPCILNGRQWDDQTNTQFGDGVLMNFQVPIAGAAGFAQFGAVGTSGAPLFCPYLPAGAGSNVLPGDFWFDNECEALAWAGNNLGTTTTFEVRVTACMELEVAYTGSVYRPLVTPPVKENDNDIRIVDAVYKILPASVSKAEGSQSWWHSLTSGVTGFADLVSNLGIPVISPAAAIGSRMVKMLGL